MKILKISLISEVFNRIVTAPIFDRHFEKMVRLYSNPDQIDECFSTEFSLSIQLNKHVCKNTVDAYMQTVNEMDYVVVYVTQLTAGVIYLIEALRKHFGNKLRIYGITSTFEVLSCNIVTETKTVDLDDINQKIPIFKYFDAVPELFRFKILPFGEIELVYFSKLKLIHQHNLTEYADLYAVLDNNYHIETEFKEQSIEPTARQNKLRLVE